MTTRRARGRNSGPSLPSAAAGAEAAARRRGSWAPRIRRRWSRRTAGCRSSSRERRSLRARCRATRPVLAAVQRVVDEARPVGRARRPLRDHRRRRRRTRRSTARCWTACCGRPCSRWRSWRSACCCSFARRPPVAALLAALALGALVTFAFTRLGVGHLNLATAFLAPIVVGNGINFGIILLARYFEERRKTADPVRGAGRGRAGQPGRNPGRGADRVGVVRLAARHRFPRLPPLRPDRRRRDPVLLGRHLPGAAGRARRARGAGAAQPGARTRGSARASRG